MHLSTTDGDLTNASGASAMTLSVGEGTGGLGETSGAPGTSKAAAAGGTMDHVARTYDLVPNDSRDGSSSTVAAAI
ncbi:hypothetical protein PsorP6_006641 [Peronosclerospora sorghi]|uniref:Uncharacterized protein n=1 Tax=Peronosclerospora sorghi TaxID=230839 RepID=A0ACC0W555_9STRA|nr:hypothetical protein PsorP6_006641 [Peronosclerospora sorghi]